MISEKAIELFVDQVEAAIKAGHEVRYIEAVQDGRDMVVCALNGDDCVLGTATVRRPGLPLREIERIFGYAAAMMICLHAALERWA
jgi:hypothetical protein